MDQPWYMAKSPAEAYAASEARQPSVPAGDQVFLNDLSPLFYCLGNTGKA